ncbi:cupin domain-containing protein [Natrialbaceae archaeon A-CW2]
MDFLDDPEPHRPENRVLHRDDAPIVDLSEVDDVRPNVGIQAIDELLELETMGAKLWHFEPGEEVGYHAHPEEEEFYFVLEGEFSLKLGPADDPEYVTVGPGTFWAAGPYEPHGHRYIGEETGVVLALGAPPGNDEVLNPYELESP